MKKASPINRTGQVMVDQRPRYDNQVIGRKSRIIRRDKRRKARFL